MPFRYDASQSTKSTILTGKSTKLLLMTSTGSSPYLESPGAAQVQGLHISRLGISNLEEHASKDSHGTMYMLLT